MIAVTGANGQLGRLVIESLIGKVPASDVVALVRNVDKAQELAALGVELREADYDKPETLTNALQGIDKLLLISSNAVGQRIPQHQAVVDAAKAQGVSLLVYTSILKAQQSPMKMAEEHVATENYIQQSGIPAVILRNGWYSENYMGSIKEVVQFGVVAGASGDGQISSAARKDYAEAAATVLTSEDDLAGNVYELAGDESFSLSEYAQELTRQSGKSVAFNSLSDAEYKDFLVSVGLPDGFAALLADSDLNARDGWLFDDSATLSKLIGRPTTPMHQTITENIY
ncbi:SDR family oxidoreductase [Litoribrevibacter albus]|uniref:NAD(P)-dependent oxidoreductase n=1 Tax=Litoribrevibacter albus TaxID=1473156 RepID=A0AA37SC97_9GAMM|nr:SDR family oxidoreductase [Litoribrevibacter albus]GLQ32135.1 NAD(P)-dependent oxidoreductase [Litoribrevibacter albus]